MLSQALRTTRHTSLSRLKLHRRFNHRLKLTSEEEETPTPVRFKKKSSRTAFIRTWEPFHQLADAWALLRVIERKYGRVAEAHFLKDYEIKNRYQVYTYVVFQDQESLRCVPEGGQSFHIPAPDIEDKPGGIGLDDIRHLLDSTDRDESFELPSAAALETGASKKRMIGARIERAAKDFYTLPKADKSSKANMPLARLFLRWGGFHKLEPIERSKDITELEWFEKTDLEQVRMRAALQWCSQITGLANPTVLRKLGARDNDEIVSNSCHVSASIDSLESSSQSMVDNPTSHETTSKPIQLPFSLTGPLESPSQSTQSPSSLSESLQPPSQSTQPPPESTPVPITSHPRQLTPEQVMAKEALKRQRLSVKQLMIKTERPVAKKARKPEGTPEVDQTLQVLDEFPREPPPQSKGVVANIWKLFGR